MALVKALTSSSLQLSLLEPPGSAEEGAGIVTTSSRDENRGLQGCGV